VIRQTIACALLAATVAMPVVAQYPLSGTLPACAIVGDTPSKDSYTIELHKNGMLSVAGVPMSFDECFEGLAKVAKTLPGEEIGPIQTSRVNVIIRAAGAVPLAAIDLMMRECARPDIAAPRIFFGATHRGDKSEGTFAYFLPIDREDGELILEMIEANTRKGRRGTAAGLYQTLKRLAGRLQPKVLKRTAITIQTDGNVAWSAALGMLDDAAHAGIPIAFLEFRATKKQQLTWQANGTRRDLRALCEAEPATTKVPCEVGPIVVGKGADVASPPRIRRGFAGYAASPRAVEHIEEVVEEIVEPPPPPPEPALGEEEMVEEVTEEVVLEETIATEGDKPHVRKKGKMRPAQKQAIDDALRWLKKHQDDDGKWDCDSFMKHDDAKVVCDGPGNAIHDVGVTGLALLAFLGDGSTLRAGPHRQQVRKAVQWLRAQQHVNGRIGTNQSHDFIYDHAIATYALTEAYGLSNFPAIKHTAQQALNYLEAHRNQGAVWRYQPRDKGNDTSVTNWCAMAYIAGRDFGLDVNKKAFGNIADWLDQVADHASGHHGYSKRGEQSSRHPGDHIRRFPLGKNEPLTGSSLMVRYMLGQREKTHPVLARSARLIASKPPIWKPKSGHIDFYSWFWCSHALFQAGGQQWRGWSQDLSKALLTGRRKDGAAKGSWDPIGVWGEDGGRVASTALAALSLQSFYRYARRIR